MLGYAPPVAGFVAGVGGCGVIVGFILRTVASTSGVALGIMVVVVVTVGGFGELVTVGVRLAGSAVEGCGIAGCQRDKKKPAATTRASNRIKTTW